MAIWSTYLNNKQTDELIAIGKELYKKKKIKGPTNYLICRHILIKEINAKKH